MCIFFLLLQRFLLVCVLFHSELILLVCVGGRRVRGQTSAAEVCQSRSDLIQGSSDQTGTSLTSTAGSEASFIIQGV